MTVHIPPYLQSYLDVADSLPQRWPELPVEDVEMVRRRFHDLVKFAAHLEAQNARLTRELDRVRPAIQKRIRVEETRCDHKFVDSTVCLKCGWAPKEPA